MASEFYMSVTFSMPDADHMEALDTLIEHFDLCDVDEARDLLSKNDLTKAQALIPKLTTEYSDYSNYHDLVKMFVDTYNQGVDNMQLIVDGSGIKGKIKAEGLDSGADSFCSAVVLLLVAMSAKDINAEAGSPMWEGYWQSQSDGSILLKFRPEE